MKNKLQLAVAVCCLCLYFNSHRALALSVNGCDIEPFSNCPGAVISFSHLSGVDLSYANLTGAIITGADLVSATLFGADLSFTDLVGTNLSFSNLSFANLTGAGLSFARLPFADLHGADLSFADMDDSDLRNANLSGAKLSNVKLSRTALSGALYDEFTVFPTGFDAAAAGMTFLDNPVVPIQLAEESKGETGIPIRKILNAGQVAKVVEARGKQIPEAVSISTGPVEQTGSSIWTPGWIAAILIGLVALAMPLFHALSGFLTHKRQFPLPPEQ